MSLQPTPMPSVRQVPVIDLRQRFGARYRIGHDEAADNDNDPWMLTIPCQQGTIYPFGADLLAVEIDYHPGAARQVAALAGVRVHQDGGLRGEMTFTFPVDLFDAVTAIVKPKRKRKLSAEHRAKLAAVGTAALARHRLWTNSKVQIDEPERVQMPSGGPQAACVQKTLFSTLAGA